MSSQHTRKYCAGTSGLNDFQGANVLNNKHILYGLSLVKEMTTHMICLLC